MTEQDLIDLNFTKTIITNEESGNGFTYYLYNYKIFDNLILSSIDSDQVINNNWSIVNFDWPKTFKLNTKQDLNQFLQVILQTPCTI